MEEGDEDKEDKMEFDEDDDDNVDWRTMVFLKKGQVSIYVIFIFGLFLF